MSQSVLYFSRSAPAEEKRAIVDRFPKRDHFLDPESVAKQRELLRNGLPIKFLPNYVLEADSYNPRESQLILFGIMPDGVKTALVLRGFRPFFDVRVPPGVDSTKFSQCMLENIHGRTDATVVRYEEVLLRPFIGYREDKVPYIRFYFSRVRDRKRALELVHGFQFGEHKLETASNDRSAHYRKLAREYHFSLCAWNEVREYKLAAHPFVKDGIRTLVADITAMRTLKSISDPELLHDRSMTMAFDLETWTPRQGDVPGVNDVFDNGNESAVIFMCGCTFSWQHSQEPLARVCITTLPVPPVPEVTIVQCEDQASIMVLFACLVERMAPEFVIEFNGSFYDWPFIIRRAKAYEEERNVPVLTRMRSAMSMVPLSKRTSFYIQGPTARKVKIDAGTQVNAEYFDAPGLICIDVRTVFRKRYPTAESSSLNFYLSENNLGLKKEMPYHKMAACYAALTRLAQTFNTRSFEEIAARAQGEDAKWLKYAPRIVEYCDYDAHSCQLLMSTCNIIMDKREMGTISYTSMADTIYYADGMRVRNFICAAGAKPKWGFAFNVISEREGADERKYPGAFILPARKGLYRDHRFTKLQRRISDDFTMADIDPARLADPRFLEEHPQRRYENGILDPDTANTSDRPCAGLDVQSMYPNIIATYNVSPEKLVFDPKEAEELSERGVRLCMTEFLYGIKGLPDSRKELVRVWLVQHDNDPKKMGLIPQQIRKLFLRRKNTKARMEYYALAREFLLKIQERRPLAEVTREELQAALVKERAARVAAYEANPIPYLEGKIRAIDATAKFFEAEWKPGMSLAQLFEEIVFYRSYYDTKQLSQKIFMNTIYGTLGESASPFFQVGLAGFVTTYGQRLLKSVKRYVEARDYTVLYGDTDSLYICCPDRMFADLDLAYESGQITRFDYWSHMISMTMVDLNKLKVDVNNYIREFTGADYLRMDYDEVFWPYVMAGKKKYIGVPHVGIVNLRVCMPDCTMEEFTRPGALFVRGLELKKRGTSQFLKINCFEVFKEAFCIESTRSLKQIVERRLGVISSLKWDNSMFQKSARYKLPKPNKRGNVTVLNFVERMRALEASHPELGIVPPLLGERYRYVVVQRYPWVYVDGHKKPIGLADKCEYLESLSNEAYIRHLGEELRIDIDYYALNELAGQFARFAIYHPQYATKEVDYDDDEAYKEADEQAHTLAKRELSKFYKTNFAMKYACKSRAYRQITKTATQAIVRALPDTAAEAWALVGSLAVDQNESAAVREAKAAIVHHALEHAKRLPFTDVKRLMQSTKKSAVELWRIYVAGESSIHAQLRPKLVAKRTRIYAELEKVLPAALQESKAVNATLEACIRDLRDKTRIDVTATTPVGTGGDKVEFEVPQLTCEADPLETGEALEQLNDIYMELVSCLHELAKMDHIEGELRFLRRSAAGIYTEPPPGAKPDVDDFMRWRASVQK